ncbi:MAG TPA: hypothetical protein VJ771_02795 [Candidatus Nitrosotalea sp.]|nr:hypothetical protein [Candidatus Nitrosotalea sp.]
MSEQNKWIPVTILAITCLVLGGTAYLPIPANASQQTVCVLQPIDMSVPSHVVNMTMRVLAEHNQTAKYVGLVQELTDKSNTGCNFVIQFERAINSNYNWVDKTAHYTISGNTLTLYTDKTPVNVPDSISFGGPSKSGKGGDVFAQQMTNWSCFAEALATYHQNLGFTGYTTCNPYAETLHTSNNIPIYVIHRSLEQALEKMAL